jgi:hypothetical protein
LIFSPQSLAHLSPSYHILHGFAQFRDGIGLGYHAAKTVFPEFGDN